MSSRLAERFVQGITGHRRPVGLLGELTTKLGARRLSEAIHWSASPVRNAILPILGKLTEPELQAPMTQHLLFETLRGVLTTSGVVAALLAGGEPRSSSNPDGGWLRDNRNRLLVVHLLLTVAVKDGDLRHDPDLVALAELLTTHAPVGCLQSGQLSTLMLATAALAAGRGEEDAAVATVCDMQALDSLAEEVPTHDNEFTDYRSISVMPTVQECTSVLPPRLPPALSQHQLVSAAASSSLPPAEGFPDPDAESMVMLQVLDRWFRLMREDIVGPLRDLLDQYRLLMQNPAQLSAKQRQLIERNVVGGVLPVRVVPIPQEGSGTKEPYFLFKFSLPAGHRALRHVRSKNKRGGAKKMSLAEAEAYWNRSKLLKRGSLVCVTLRGNPLLLGTVEVRDSQALARGQFEVGLSFEKLEYRATVLRMLERAPPFHTKHPMRGMQLVAVCPSYFSYEPVLKRLQLLMSVPFMEELVLGNAAAAREARPPPWSYCALPHTIPRMCPKPFSSLDKSQQQAFVYAMTHRVATLQGPPGTGKTFLGLLLALALLKHTNERIVCVCYTNHALDQFLELLLDNGVKNIVRIGGQCKSAQLQPYTLWEKSKNAASLSDAARRACAITYKRRDDVRAELDQLLNQKRNIGPKWWRSVGEYLEDMHSEKFRQLDTMAAQGGDGDGGFQVAGALGKQKGEEDYLWKRWLKGRDPGRFIHLKEAPLWQLSREQREKLKLQWQDEMFGGDRQRAAKLIAELQQSERALRRLYDSKHVETINAARVIGVTTTGAAMREHLLRDVDAGIMMIEEAAEILEPRVLVCLTRRTRHLIQIGDQQQLRPKTEHYPLSISCRRTGHNLNLSMFERLVLSGHPFRALSTQHRMRPEVSGIARALTYPNLIDAATVTSDKRPPLVGIQTTVAFVDHRVPEGGGGQEGSGDDGSKINGHEADMVVAAAKYFLQQGYRPSQITALTPYLAQMSEIQLRLKRMKVAAFVDSRDLQDLRASGARLRGTRSTGAGDGEDSDSDWEDEGNGSVLPQQGVRVATVDNYQGEECDIILVSLVRSNAQGNLGFVAEKERVNVMLTRARRGMVIFGNAKHMLASRNAEGKQVWSTVVGHLQLRGLFYPDGFPACCVVHSNPRRLATAEQFAQLAPLGGCDQPCGTLLTCGHACPLLCHPSDRDHKSTVCAAKTTMQCKQGHAVHHVPCSKASKYRKELLEYTLGSRSAALGPPALPFRCKVRMDAHCAELHRIPRTCDDVTRRRALKKCHRCAAAKQRQAREAAAKKRKAEEEIARRQQLLCKEGGGEGKRPTSEEVAAASGMTNGAAAAAAAAPDVAAAAASPAPAAAASVAATAAAAAAAAPLPYSASTAGDFGAGMANGGKEGDGSGGGCLDEWAYVDPPATVNVAPVPQQDAAKADAATVDPPPAQLSTTSGHSHDIVV